MRLTTFSDYSLRVLMYVGLQDKRLVTIAEMARTYGISANHLMKVVHFLAQHGYLETVRGKGGGVRLPRAPETINIADIMRHTESNVALVECFSANHSNCRLMPSCQLKRILREAEEAFYATLSRYTLADLLAQPQRLKHTLSVPVVSGPTAGSD